MNRIMVNAEYAQAFEERFRNRAGLIDQEPGFIRNMVLQPTDHDAPYVVMTFWQTRQHFLDWTQSESFRQAHHQAAQAPREMFAGKSKLETFETFTDTQT